MSQGQYNSWFGVNRVVGVITSPVTSLEIIPAVENYAIIIDILFATANINSDVTVTDEDGTILGPKMYLNARSGAALDDCWMRAPVGKGIKITTTNSGEVSYYLLYHTDREQRT